MIYWGLTALNHGSSLALFRNHELLLHNTSKSDQVDSVIDLEAMYYGYPDRIFWYERPWIKKARQIRAGQFRTALDLSVLPRNHLKKFKDIPIIYTPHHASHAAAGYYSGPFDHCAIVVLDAIGEFECATIWEGKDGEIRKIWSRSYPHSLGLFYSAFTQLLGMTAIRDEHILQRMSELGDPNRFYKEVSSYFKSGILNLNYNFHRGVLNWEQSNSQAIRIIDAADIAAAVQRVFEEQVQRVMIRAKYLTGSNNLVYMGGCAMNSLANRRVVEPNFKHIWSLPNPGDPSSSIGAVLYHTKSRVHNYTWAPVKHIAVYR